MDLSKQERAILLFYNIIIKTEGLISHDIILEAIDKLNKSYRYDIKFTRIPSEFKTELVLKSYSKFKLDKSQSMLFSKFIPVSCTWSRGLILSNDELTFGKETIEYKDKEIILDNRDPEFNENKLYIIYKITNTKLFKSRVSNLKEHSLIFYVPEKYNDKLSLYLISIIDKLNKE